MNIIAEQTDTTTMSMEYNITTETAPDNVTAEAEVGTDPRTSGRVYPERVQQIFYELRQACLNKLQKDPHPEPESGVYCNRTLDRWGGCWPDTPAGSVAKIPCLDIPSFNTAEFAYKECLENGTWSRHPAFGDSWANYTSCRTNIDMSMDDSKYVLIFIGGFAVSLVMLVISLAIFFRFKQLRCDRITIHKNLFLSYVFTGISWILYYVLVALDGDVLLHNPVWCQVLHVICQHFTVCNFLWMFCEGLYLNTIMVCAFNSGKVLIVSCYLIGWGLPTVLTSIYAGIRSNDSTASIDCWLNESHLQWIMYGPIILSIVINAVFLINIVRLLITKLSQMPEATQTRKATRATLILVPLLGLQYLLFPIRPAAGSELEEFYHVTVALVISLQGAFVSVIYCFCNGEVISLMTRKYRQHRLMRSRSSMKSCSVNAGMVYTTIDNTAGHSNYSVAFKDPVVEKSQFESEDA